MARDEVSSLLVRIGATGDLDALASLFDRAAPGLLRLALRVTGDPVEAEDVLQETFLAVLKGAHTYDPSRASGAWLGTILANVASRRRRKADPLRLLEDIESAAPSGESRDSEEWRRTRAAIEDLPPRERSAVLLRFEQGLPPKKIAELLDISESSVRSLLARGTQRLRRRLLALALPLPMGSRLTTVDLLARVRERLVAGTAAASSSGAVAASVLVSGGIAVSVKKAVVVVAVLVLGAGSWGVFHLASDRLPNDRAASGPPVADLDSEPGGSPRGLAAHPRADGSPQSSKPSESKTPDPRYSGQIGDEEGRPIPGARLSVISAMGRRGKPDVAGLADVALDAEGKFAFSIPDAVGQVTTRVRAEGRVAQSGGETQLVFPGVPARITLLRAVDLRVLALDATTDRPIAGARIRAYGPFTASVDGLRSQQPVDEAIADATGRAVLHAKLGEANLVVSAQGHANAIITAIDARPSGADVTARLAPGTKIEGRFVDAEGRGKGDLRIDARGYPLYDASTRTDPDGRFVLTGAPSSADPVEPFLQSRLELWVQQPGRPPPRWYRVDPPASGETKAVSLVWKEGRPLRGTVRQSDGSPAAGIFVAALPDDSRTRFGLLNWSEAPLASDATGRFALASVPPGPVIVRAWGSPPDGATVTAAERKLSVPDAGEIPDVELIVSEKTSLTVHATSADGSPLAGAWVQWISAAPPHDHLAGATTSESGDALLEGDGQPDDWVVVDSAGHAPTRSVVDQEALTRRRIDVRMPAGQIRGSVARLDGSPLAVEVRATLMVRDLAGVEQWMQSSRFRKTDAQGQFEISGVGDGDYRVDVPTTEWRCLGGSVAAHAGDDVRLVVGNVEETRGLDVEVELVDAETGKRFENHSFEVRLVEAGSKDLSARPLDWIQGVQATPGLYRTYYPPKPGVYDVVVPATWGFREGRISGVRVAIGDERATLRLAMDRGRRIRGRVVDLRSQPVKGVWVKSGALRAVTAADGTYELSGLEEGDVDVVIDHRYGRSDPRRVTVGGGAIPTIDFQIATGGAIVVSVPRGRRPVERMVVVATPADGGIPARIEIPAAAFLTGAAAGGSIEVPRLVPGRYHVEASWDGRSVASDEVDVADRATSRVDAHP